MKTTRTYEYDGRSCTVAELADIAGVTVYRMYGRLREVDDDVKWAMFPRRHTVSKLGQGKRITYQGKEWYFDALADHVGMKEAALRLRLRKHGGDADKAMETKYRRHRVVIWEAVEYPTARHLARHLGKPYTTVRTMLERASGAAKSPDQL